MNKARISITLPPEIVSEIDRAEPNRSRFVLTAVVRELDRRRRERLRESLDSPHPESLKVSDEGYEEWYQGLPDSATSDLLVRDGGRVIRWETDRGWSREEE